MKKPVPVVRAKWVADSLAHGRLLDVSGYLLDRVATDRGQIMLAQLWTSRGPPSQPGRSGVQSTIRKNDNAPAANPLEAQEGGLLTEPSPRPKGCKRLRLSEVIVASSRSFGLGCTGEQVEDLEVHDRSGQTASLASDTACPHASGPPASGSQGSDFLTSQELRCILEAEARLAAADPALRIDSSSCRNEQVVGCKSVVDVREELPGACTSEDDLIWKGLEDLEVAAARKELSGHAFGSNRVANARPGYKVAALTYPLGQEDPASRNSVRLSTHLAWPRSKDPLEIVPFPSEDGQGSGSQEIDLSRVIVWWQGVSAWRGPATHTDIRGEEEAMLVTLCQAGRTSHTLPVVEDATLSLPHDQEVMKNTVGPRCDQVEFANSTRLVLHLRLRYSILVAALRGSLLAPVTRVSYKDDGQSGTNGRCPEFAGAARDATIDWASSRRNETPQSTDFARAARDFSTDRLAKAPPTPM